MKKTIYSGFSFVEVVISIAIASVISALSISMLLQGSDIFMDAKNDSRLLNESRAAVWRISRELHNLSSNHFLALSNDNRLYIKDANSNQIDFKIAGKMLKVNRSGKENPLAEFLHGTFKNKFKYVSTNNDTINGSANLSSVVASEVNLLKIDFKFLKDDAIIDIETQVYPYNFRFGRKMSYHD